MRRNRVGALVGRYRRDRTFRAHVAALGSLAASMAFALYNGVLGLVYRAPWNGSICVYYLLLSGIRGYILYTGHRLAGVPPANRRRPERRARALSAGALLALNLTLIAPISMMVRMRRPVDMGLIPAIATAVYATWKITMAAIRYRRRTRTGSGLMAQLRVVGLVDALVSILTLQNTLIMVNDADGGRSMLTLSAWSSAVIFTGIVAISLHNWKQRSKNL